MLLIDLSMQQCYLIQHCSEEITGRIVFCYIMTSFSFPCNKAFKEKKKPTSISNSLCFAAKIDCDESNSPNQLCSMVLSEEKNSTYVSLQNIYSIYLYVQTA